MGAIDYQELDECSHTWAGCWTEQTGLRFHTFLSTLPCIDSSCSFTPHIKPESYYLHPRGMACGILVPHPGIKPGPTAVTVQAWHHPGRLLESWDFTLGLVGRQDPNQGELERGVWHLAAWDSGMQEKIYGSPFIFQVGNCLPAVSQKTNITFGRLVLPSDFWDNSRTFKSQKNLFSSLLLFLTPHPHSLANF